MKKNILILFTFLVTALPVFAAQEYPSLEILNKTNLAGYFNNWLGYPYDSHGCLHFMPADIFLLTKIIPPETPLRIKKYRLEKDDLPFKIDKISYLVDITQTPTDIEKHMSNIKNGKTELLVYPSLGKLLILVNDFPYAQVNMLAGPSESFFMPFKVEKDQPIDWDGVLTTPTDAGEYKILRSTDHYISNTYYQNTLVPFGAWIIKKAGNWLFEENGAWHPLPENVRQDLLLPPAQRQYNYYDVAADSSGQVQAARYAGHDFGKYVLLWTQDGSHFYPEMGYAAGELCYEQIVLVKDLVHLLTLPGSDDFESCIAQNNDFSFYKSLEEFISSQGRVVSTNVHSELYNYYRLFHHWPMKAAELANLDSRILKAFDEYENNRLPRNPVARQKALGLVHYLKVNALVIDKQAYWYTKLKQDWPFWQNLRLKLREDFDKMGILALENRQNIVEQWLNDRLEFKSVSPPAMAKNLQALSFSVFFKPDEKDAVFTQREEAIMRDLLRKTTSREGEGLDLACVKALNDYNFGVLLNNILGDLYQSHGCMHVSPRNSYFLYRLLPTGAEIKLYDQAKKIDPVILKGVPYLADMINFSQDLDKLKNSFAVTEEVKVDVYPYSGYWLIYLKNKPFAKLQVKGGPRDKLSVLQGRAKDGKPIFESHLAYPTPPGNYYVFDKVQNYLSQLYYDTTVIPMGARIRKERGRWRFLNAQGDWEVVPPTIEEDLSRPIEQREYTYYDEIKSADGQEQSFAWGSHPFGRYAVIMSQDKKNMSPELIHSSGDLIMEERQLVNDLIKILSSPNDVLDDCIRQNSPNFGLYRACFEFIKNPQREDLIQGKERANYRLYYGLTLTSAEAKLLPKDVLVAYKILRTKQPLTEEEEKLLIREGIAYRRGGELKINREKILGLQYDTYQYVVTIQKYAHHYQVLKENWEALSRLRQAMLADFNKFVIKDPVFFQNFMRELMLKRIELEKISQEEAINVLRNILGDNK